MKHCAIDTETTGLLLPDGASLDRQPRIIEIAMAIWDDQTGDTRELQTLIDPQIEIPDEITRLTKISNEDVKGKRSFKDVADNVVRHLADCDVVLAHNLAFDWSILRLEYERLGRTLHFNGRKVCTVEASIARCMRRMSLQNLYFELFNEKFTGAHRAITDVLATLRVYQRLRHDHVIN